MTNLKKGSTGSAVVTMQTMLIACGYSCGASGADGDFGKNTLAALTAFQTDRGLEADGMDSLLSIVITSISDLQRLHYTAFIPMCPKIMAFETA